MKKQRVIIVFVIFVFSLLVGANRKAIKEIGREITKYSIFNSVSAYEKKEFFYSTVYYAKEDEQYVDTIGYSADYYFTVLTKDFDVNEDIEKINIILYPHKEDLSKAMGISYSEKPPTGVYYAGVINILSPSTFSEEKEWEQMAAFLKDGPIIHEMCHYFLDIKTRGNYEPWFSEGVALYYEKKYTNFTWRADLNGVSEGIRPLHMKSYFKEENEIKAYRCAFEIIDDFVSEKGEKGLMEIYDKLHSGIQFDLAIKSYME